jgi:type I restriction enzyme S subunit
MRRAVESEITNLKSRALPAGYKQTEVGVIPEDWEVRQLSECVTISHGFPFASNYFANSGPHRLTTPGHFFESGGFRDIGEKQKYYIGPVPKDYILEPGDVIVAMTEQADGLLGSTAKIPNEHGYLHNQRLGRVRTRTPEVDLDYVVLIFNSSGYRAKVRETAAGTKVKHTSPAKLLEILVQIPPLPEQRAIASALSDVDALLGALDRLIAKKRDLKQAAMQHLLTGQTRLPGFKGEWEVVELERIADRNRPWSFTGGPFGSNLKSSDYTKEGVRIIQLQNIGDGEFKNGYEVYTSIAKADDLLSCNIYPGEIILSKMGDPVARACLIPTQHDRYLMCSDGIRLAVDPNRFDNYFVFAQINAPDFRSKAENSSTGSTRKRIGLFELRRLTLDCPPTKAEQTAIAEVLSDMDAEIAALEQRREKTRALKQGMMQELLTGRTRLV